MTDEINTSEIEAEAPEQVEQEEVQQTEETQENHGHKTLEEYVAGGGDPEMYRGKKAFDQYYERNQDLQRIQKENKALANNVNKVLASQKEMLQSKYEEKITGLEAKLEKAHEDMDTKQAVKIQAQITKAEVKRDEALNEQVQQPAQVPQSHTEEVQYFREDYPVLDQQSADYDAELDRAVSSLVDSQYNPAMTDREVRRLMKSSLKQVKANTPKYNQKQAKKPAKTGQPSKKSVKPSKEAALSKLDDNARGLYNYFIENNDKAAADEFLKNVSGT